MARKPRPESETSCYHFINRGVNKNKIFINKRDYEYYLKLVKEYRNRFDINIFHYCIMSNHAHVLLKAESLKNLSRFGYFIHRRYAYYYIRNYQWPGQVFRRHFISIPIGKDAYLLECGRYIERNPLDAGFVKDPGDYPYSSYRYYAYGTLDDLITESPLYQSLGYTPEARMSAYRFYVCHDRAQTGRLTVPL